MEAVRADRLVSEAIRVEGSALAIETTRSEAVEIDLNRIGRLLVVGGGKAGAGMAVGLEQALAPLDLGPEWFGGVLSVPADCAGVETERIRLVGGRPAGVNEPRAEGAAAASEMLQMAEAAGPEDVVLCLLSGGGSALLPAPLDGVSLDEKVAVARSLAAAGATIDQLNTVRQHLSRFKGGGLARACRAGRLVTLVISDVLGDPLDLIASGPTVQPQTTPSDALAAIDSLGLTTEPELAGVVARLQARCDEPPAEPPSTSATTLLLANNATAIDAAGIEAERRGYRHAMDAATSSEGAAEEVGRHHARMARQMRDAPEPNAPNCLITGGEPTVKLAPPDIRGRGGRNQQLAVAALKEFGDCRDVALVSGGTDGEDGPTDAAGGMIDAAIAERLREADLDDTLRRNDTYTLLGSADGLLMTGPSGTNVCDLRVVTVGKS